MVTNWLLKSYSRGIKLFHLCQPATITHPKSFLSVTEETIECQQVYQWARNKLATVETSWPKSNWLLSNKRVSLSNFLYIRLKLYIYLFIRLFLSNSWRRSYHTCEQAKGREFSSYSNLTISGVCSEIMNYFWNKRWRIFDIWERSITLLQS